MRKKDLIYENKDRTGTQYIYEFDNEYGASVIKNKISYGNEQGLWELAILFFNSENGYEVIQDNSLIQDITGKEFIYDSVIGFLTEKEVDEILNKIEQYEEKLWN